MKTPIILRIFKDGQLIDVKQFDTSQITLGQEEECLVQLKDSSVSPIHAMLERRDAGFYVCDLGSHSGTMKNGAAILDDPISSGDQIGIGPFTIHFFLGVPKPKAPPIGPKPSLPESAPVSPEVGGPNVAVAPPPPPPAAAASAVTASVPTPANKAGVATAVPTAQPEATKPPAKGKKASMPVAAPNTSSGTSSGSPKVTPPQAQVQAQPKKSVASPEGLKAGTYAPPSEIRDLRDYLKPTKGPVVEVLIAWRERVIQSYHYVAAQVVNIGPTSGADIFVPAPYTVQMTPFLEISSAGVRVFVPDSTTIEVINEAGRADLAEVQRLGKATKQATGNTLRIDQGDLACLTFGDGAYQIFVRYVPASPVPVLASPMDFSAGEMTAGIASIVLVGLFALYMTMLTPSDEEKPKEDERVAVVVFNKAKPTPPPPPPVEKTPPKVVEAQPTPTPPPKKIVVSDKTQVKAASKASAAEGRAAQMRPNPNSTSKKFGSIKQGGSVKLSPTESANAQSQKDVTKTGLLSAFGGGGVRKNLDKAYSGSGELLGMADKATGTSGQASDRAGDDIGSRFRETGGGKGVATTGIAGIGGKGRGSGNSGYGSGGLGGKGSVSIDAGGAEESFEGTIDREAVRRVIRSILNQIKSCYERALRGNTGLEGKVVIRFVIEDQGRVRQASTKSSTLGDNGVERCVADRIRGQRFPDPPAGTIAEVDYPFVFGAQK